MDVLHIDIEAYSSIDIRKAGAYRYCRSIDFEVLLVAFAFNDEPTKIIDLAAGEKLPNRFTEALLDNKVKKVAHNAVFERQCFEQIGYKTPVEAWECTAIKSAYCGLPLALGKVSEALNLTSTKLATGKALIRYFCVPCKPTKTNGKRFRNFYYHNLEKWEDFKKYCIQDVEAEREICKRLAKYKIPKFERDNWILDQKINDKGVLLDLSMAKNATRIHSIYVSELIERAKELTGLDNPNSPAQLKKWLSNALGKPITTLAKNELNSLINEVEDGTIKEVLRIRKKLSKTSVKKYIAMLICACLDGRARGLFQFYGASRTGRWAGRLIQLQNLPQNKIKALEEARALIANNDYVGTINICKRITEEIGKEGYELDLSDLLSQLIRTTLIAKEGHTFSVADFSAIEARVIAWYASEEWRLEVFKGDGKIYEASASMMFNEPIENCQKTSGNGLRAKGKVAELALGYQGGVGALKAMGGERMGLSETEMKTIVTKWRKANPKVVKLWKDVNNYAMIALKNKGRRVFSKCKKLAYFYNGEVLQIRLPSGRCLFYFEPKLSTNHFDNKCIKYKGIHSETKKWVDLETYGGKLVENIVQATARDLLAFSMQNLDANGFDISLHVHDEAAAEIPDRGEELNEEKLIEMCDIMSIRPDWAKDLPLTADGYLTPFYKKD